MSINAHGLPRRVAFAFAVYMIAIVGAMGVSVAPAGAATPGPGFTIQSLARPTNFLPGETSGSDSYHIVVTNAGGRPTDGDPITVADTVPAGLTVQSIEFYLSSEVSGGGLDLSSDCTIVPVQCVLPAPEVVSPGGFLQMIVHVASEPGAASSVTNTARVEGGGASTASTSSQNEVSSAPAPFGVEDFSMYVAGVDGAADTQAGDHPYAVTANLDFNTVLSSYKERGGLGPYYELGTPEDSKDVVVDLPMGLVGNPTTAPQCPLHDLTVAEVGNGTRPLCPADTRIGNVALTKNSQTSQSIESSAAGEDSELSALYNLAPEHGYPAEFGFMYLGESVHLYAGVVSTPVGYVLRVSTPDIPTLSDEGHVLGVSLTFFGDPAQEDGAGASAAFFTNPMDCSGEPLATSLHMDSWSAPGSYNADGTPDFSDPNWLEGTSGLAAVAGCNQLRFEPGIEVEPETTQADSPTGLNVDLKVPQAPNVPGVPATPELKDATVTLPAGMSLSPSAANGLEACSPAQIGLGDNSQPTCPEASRIGTVELTTPLLAKPIGGSVYLAQQNDNPFGSLVALYIVVDDPTTGVLIKLPGQVSLDPLTGQVTTTVDNNPQLPFSELKLRFKEGPRAPLVTPQACGSYTTTTSLTPWSAPQSGPPATPSDSFAITSGCGADFAPSFSAGTVNNQAGASSPFSLTFSRQDGEQRLSGAQVTMPPGLLGKIAGVAQCPEPQASKGECGEGSLLGEATTAVGPGADPYWVTGGKVYLTGPYNGGPFGLSIVVPTTAGPFTLTGNAGFGKEVVRASIRVNPSTAQITVLSDPLPTILEGIPLDIRTVNVTVNRSGFMFNPTSCAPSSVTGTIASTSSVSASVSSPFEAANCAALAFKPSFSASTQAKTSKADGASLVVKVAQRAAEANIHKVDLTLPKVLPSRLTTLQKACTEAQFNANPAGCPAGAFIGTATAHTPVLNVPMSGPAILVSHGGAAFPDVEFLLQGEGVEIVLDGKTQIKNGVTYSHFETVPDAPISSFETVLPEGTHSILGTNLPAKAKYSLCGQKLTMPTTITGQNGAVITQTTKIAVTGCAKGKALTKAQKLAKALKTCHKKAKGKRARCEKRARKQYAPAKAGARQKKR